MHRCPEVELLRLARDFDQAALAELYDRYNSGIYHYAVRLLGDPCQAEDCAADTFSRLLHALRDGGGPTDNLKAYLYRSAHNWIVDHFRRTPPLPLEPDATFVRSDQDTEEEAANNITKKKVRMALRLLTAEQRQVIALRFVEGWEPDEVATCMQRPVGAVKSLQHRAVAALQKILLEEQGNN